MSDTKKEILTTHLHSIYSEIDRLIKVLTAARSFYADIDEHRIGITLEDSSIPTIYASEQMHDIIAERLKVEMKLLEESIDKNMREAITTRTQLKNV